MLDAASLMVAGTAAADAVERARRMPGLRVGLHLVVVEGPAVLPPKEIPELVGADGLFPSDQAGLGMRYAFSPAARRQLGAEVAAQFDAFRATGLPFAHVDAHKHMHMSPQVGALLAQNARRCGVPRVRVPMEPCAVLRAIGAPCGMGAQAMEAWARWQRRRFREFVVPDAVFGIAWSGHMTEDRLLRLIPHLPPGEVEIYLHPASRRDHVLEALMPDYDHVGELAALQSAAVRAALGR